MGEAKRKVAQATALSAKEKSTGLGLTADRKGSSGGRTCTGMGQWMVSGSQSSAQPAGLSIVHPRTWLGLGTHLGILILLVTMNGFGCGAISRLTLLSSATLCAGCVSG